MYGVLTLKHILNENYVSNRHKIVLWNVSMISSATYYYTKHKENLDYWIRIMKCAKSTMNYDMAKQS